MLAYTIIQAVLVIGAWLVLRQRRGRKSRGLVRYAALATLGFVPAVYLSRRIAFQD